VLSKLDDYPVHQTAEPLAHPATSDRHAYDRYWFNGYAGDGEYYFGVGAARYPNLGILDGGFSIVRAGEQHAFHASRRMPAEPTDTTIGPFAIEIIEPMGRTRVRVDENDTGIGCDLVFTPRTAPVEEGRQTARRQGRLLMDATRFAQWGRWEGEITYDGQTVAVDGVPGTKDRSWGIRPVGDPAPPGAPPTALPQVFFLWAPLHWDDRCTHFAVFEDGDGVPWHTDAMVVPTHDGEGLPPIDDPGVRVLPGVEHQIEYEPGTRRARSARIALIEADSRRHDIDLEPLICFRMKGIGYMHPVWGHGMWKGELAVGGESWSTDGLDEMAPDNQHIQQVVRARMGDEEGIGVLEQIAFGPHARYGFTDLLDPA
jgi:hypothetical protein